MAETMVERVKAAISDYRTRTGYDFDPEGFARAAIKAIHAQLEEMLDAAEDRYLSEGAYDDGSANEEFVMDLFLALEAATDSTDTASAGQA